MSTGSAHAGEAASIAEVSEEASADEPTPRARRGRPGYDRAQVLEIAVKLFNEQGYDGTSVSSLASALGLSKAALYHHFASKEQILEIALDDALGGLESVLDGALADEGTAATRLVTVIAGAVRVLTGKLPQVTLLLRVHGNSEIERAALERRRIFDQRVAHLVGQAQQEGALRRDIRPSVTTRLMFGMINSIIEWYRPAHTSLTPEELVDDVTRVIFDGLRAR
ncbi:TetR/AcrR family transcriptional regulator [Microbacterium sp. 13-71-7]|jgi:AcrR family transcriptional regulator|uniref:TetR/AcrR family transcriptional regulator n=1 Tax=Microbacterium sp. 13-71-7 TaxID=1970399 RepID=UPI000BD408F9|nr:TetR/AcrR family transcriptional regulator [Microbacterium sp. 13-71-7]OZB85092.1 MAG: TetR family transcriptional regulator [Microbacterium sp. 13-71-7]